MKNALNWFEIPVADLDRAVTFYEGVLGLSLKREMFGTTPIAIFPSEDPGVGGALAALPNRKPAQDGAVIYLDATGRLDAALERIPRSGGEVVRGKTDIGEPGFIAQFRDPEGNVVGLHAPR
jgi:uncharacterized protein